VEAVDMGAEGCKVLGHPAMQILDRLLAVIAVSHTCLVGDHKNQIATVIERLDRQLGAVEPLEILVPVDITLVAVEEAAWIQKQGRPGNRLRQQSASSIKPQRMWPTVICSC